MRNNTPSPRYSGERDGARGLPYAPNTPHPQTPLPGVPGRGEPEFKRFATCVGHRGLSARGRGSISPSGLLRSEPRPTIASRSNLKTKKGLTASCACRTCCACCACRACRACRAYRASSACCACRAYRAFRARGARHACRAYCSGVACRESLASLSGPPRSNPAVGAGFTCAGAHAMTIITVTTPVMRVRQVTLSTVESLCMVLPRIADSTIVSVESVTPSLPSSHSQARKRLYEKHPPPGSGARSWCRESIGLSHVSALLQFVRQCSRFDGDRAGRVQRGALLSVRNLPLDGAGCGRLRIAQSHQLRQLAPAGPDRRSTLRRLGDVGAFATIRAVAAGKYACEVAHVPRLRHTADPGSEFSASRAIPASVRPASPRGPFSWRRAS